MIKVRKDGHVLDIQALKGADGKSAYQYAVEAGFEGTEQEFINLLIEGTNTINIHLTDTTAHDDIRQLLTEMQVKINDSNTHVTSEFKSELLELLSSFDDLSNKVTEIEKVVEDDLVLQIIDPMQATEEGYAADAYKTKLAIEEYVDEQIAAIPILDVSSQINTHNVATDAHNDIRELITGLTTRLNTLADSDDVTLDQMKEVVAYIKANRELIESITTDKVNVADIIDNLTTAVANKPLSANQGVVLKSLIDETNVAIDSTDERLEELKESVLQIVSFDSSTGVLVTKSSDYTG